MNDLLGRIVILLARVLLGMDTIQAALLKLVNAMDSTAIETIPKNIETIVTNTQLAVQNPTTGLALIIPAIADLKAFVTTQDSELLAAIGAITPSPPAPPPSADDNALAVWSFNAGGTGYNAYAAWYALQETLMRVVQQDHVELRGLRNAPGFAVQAGDRFVGVSYEYPPYAPQPDWSAIGSYSSVLAWLQATESHFTWDYDQYTGFCYTTESLPGSQRYFCILTAADFAALSSLAVLVPPVWPGLASVTLGTPVAISAGFTITEPMHGVIVAITAVAAKQMYYTYDDIRAYRHIGALAFADDNGDLETWQSLGFVSAVYCCRQMTVAAAVKVMSADGTVGTVTPWLRSS